MQETLSLMGLGFVNAVTPINLLIMFLSTAMGITIGCLPGLSAAMGVALLLPITFGMDPASGLITLGGIYCGAIFGGSISAILIHTPGTPASAATAIEGYELTKKGQAAKALTVACVASFIGGLLSCISLYFFSPLLAQLALQFKSPEYFWLSLFGLTIIAGVSNKSLLKGLISGVLGLLIFTIGMDPMEGVERFMFNQSELYNGINVTCALIGLSGLKIITFGPRPQDFFACNAPIKGLYELGVEVEENSELDLLVSYKEHANDPRIEDVCKDMAAEMGEGHYYPDLLARMAQFELTLLDWADAHKGSKKYVAFADKCWPAFPSQFGFEPCYVNSRLVSRGIPVSCEVDIYGALSEYIGMCASGDTVTLLDINNSVPQYIYDEDIAGKFDYSLTDTFMGFHCGNTPACKMCNDRAVKYQLIQHRLLEPAGSDTDFTRGTLEGDIAPSDITFYRLQCDSEGNLRSYIAEGEILPVATRSFGGIAVFGIHEMGRFYRHVLVQKRYPHHGAVAFGHYGKILFEVLKFLGIQDIAYNQPKSLPYPTENPFA